jgi:hypothetical protein
MTETTQRSVLPMTDDRELTNTEVEAFQRDALFEDPGSLSAEQYPRAWKSDRSNGRPSERVPPSRDPAPRSRYA